MADKEKAKEPAKPAKKLTEQEILASYKMVKGDYRVKVRIYEANDLIPAKAGGLAAVTNVFGKAGADPMVRVEIMNQKKYTKPKKKTLSPLFNEVFFFRLKGMDKEQLETMTIKFTVLDKNSFIAKDSIIGSYELDLTSVYFSLNHELYQIWLTLTDPTDEREGIMGYLKVSLECLGPNDEPNVHDVTTDKDPNLTKEKSFFSSKVKQEGHVVAMEVYRAEALAPMDMHKPEVDGYVMCKYSGIKNRSKEVTSKNPEWNQKVMLGCMLPNQSKFIQVEVWDSDLVGSDDLIGNFKVSFINIREKEIKPRWGNLYGAPLSAKDNKDAELMTLYGQDLGSTYRGRIFYGLTSYNYGDPKTALEDLKFNFPQDPIPQSPQRTYLLRVDILEGHELPEKENAIVHVAMGPYMIKTSPIKIDGGRALWYEALADKKVVFPCERDEIPDCIFYFADADEEYRRHCFFRLKAHDILVEHEDQEGIGKPRVIKLKEDKALNLLSDDEFPGFLFVKVSLFAVNPPPRPPLEKNIKTQDFELRVHLYIGRNLPPADEEGASDPFVIVRCAGQLKQSSVKSKTLNPGWYETLTMDVTLPVFEKDHVPSGMMVALYDADDDEGKKRDLLGRTWATFEDNFCNYRITKGDSVNEMVEMIYRKPRWWNVRYDGVDEVQGKIMFGYVLIKKQDAYKVPFEELRPEATPQKIHIFVIGLRDVEENHGSLSQRKLKALSASFDISGDDYDPVTTASEKIINCGVNLNTYLPITIDVPRNRALCPVLDTFIYDHSTNAADNSDRQLLGLTTIDLSNILSKYYMTKSEREREEEIQEQEDIVDNLDKETKVELGGAIPEKIDEIEYNDLGDEDLFRHIAWELPKRNKVLPDDEFNIKKDEIQKSKISKENMSHVMASASKANFAMYDAPIEMILPSEPQRKILGEEQEDEEEEEENRESQLSQKQLLNKVAEEDLARKKGNYNSQIAPGFQMSEKMNPKKFLDDEEVEQENSLNEGSIKDQKKGSVGLIPFSDVVSKEHTPVMQPNASKKSLKVYRPMLEEEAALNKENGKEEDYKTPMAKSKSPQENIVEFNKGNNNDIQASRKSNEMQQSKNSNNVSRKASSKSQKPLVESINGNNNGNGTNMKNSQKNSMRNSMNLDLSPIKEDPMENRQLYETLRVTSKMSIDEASKISSGALSMKDIPGDNLKLTTKPRVEKKEDDGLANKLKLFSKNLSKKLLNKIKKNEEHYEEFDSDEDEDLNITPEWLRDRDRVPDDLEDKIPMDKYIKRFAVMRGQTRGKTKQFNTDQGEAMEQIALLKCIFLEGKIDDTPEGKEKMEKKKNKLKELMRPLDYIARVYILTGKDIQPLSDGKPNPYLRIEMGAKKFNLKDETLNKETFQPEFYKCFECPCKIPGSAFLRIEVWDGKDGVGDEDEMIGYTEIDLEDRHFTGRWREMPKKPIELRNLKSEVISGSQGRLELWAELIPQKMKTRFPKLDICPPPKYKFELRAIVWGTQDTIFKDELEKCNDLYARGGPANLEQFETDVHWRCRAKGSFNWRWKFPVTYPLRSEDDYGADKFKISLWDKDIVTADELIGENTIDLNGHKMIEKACKRQKAVKMHKRVLERAGEISDRLWYDVYHPEALDFNGKQLTQGKVQMSFELIPAIEADKRKNGYGRDPPNLYPVLPEPVGRFKFDFLNPLGMCKELLGPDLYGKIWKVLCSIICTIFLVFLLYVIATQGIAVAVVG